ncbi:MAG: cupin domain-containing protein, partial [SAR324 cluster bacterium]|nr:cupin domain-containing protein [SAR324 cluster bacterium]
GPDGIDSGSPHIHAITSEAYYVLEGEGLVEFNDLEKGFYTMPLKKGQFLQFSPCVMHRLINKGHLEILGIMGNAGLAENGDARIYFGRAVDEDSETYQNIVNLPKNEGLEGALKRRDLATKGYQELIQLWETDQSAYFQELKRFISKHQQFVHENQERFLPFIESGPMAWGHSAENLMKEAPTDLRHNNLVSDLIKEDYLYGMCGTLKVIHPN